MAKEIFAKNKIAIIGSGHIGSALAEGLVRGGINPQQIIVAGPSALQNHRFQKLGIQITCNNTDAVYMADWVFLSVKPKVVLEVLKEICQIINGKVVVSLAAGVCMAKLKKHAGRVHIARIMPNMPIAINRGIIGYLDGNLSKDEKKNLRCILSNLGVVIEVKSEHDLDIITLISGCGPGIVSFLIETMANSAKRLGLTIKTADLLARQTFNGTLAYLEHFDISSKTLIKSVATKGGITEAILSDFVKHGFTQDFSRTIAVGYTRIKKLNK